MNNLVSQGVKEELHIQYLFYNLIWLNLCHRGRKKAHKLEMSLWILLVCLKTIILQEFTLPYKLAHAKCLLNIYRVEMWSSQHAVHSALSYCIS